MIKNFICYACNEPRFNSPVELAQHIVIRNNEAHQRYRLWALLTVRQGKVAVGVSGGASPLIYVKRGNDNDS